MPACLSRVAVSDLLCSLFFAQSVFKLFLWDIAFFMLAGKSFSHQAPVLKVASFLPALLLILGVTWLISSGDKNEDFRDGDSEPTSLPLCHYRYHSYKSGEYTSEAPLLAAFSTWSPISLPHLSPWPSCFRFVYVFLKGLRKENTAGSMTLRSSLCIQLFAIYCMVL